MIFRKNIAKSIFIGGLLSMALASRVSAADVTGIVAGDNVNVRTEPHLDGDVLTKFNDGQALNIIGQDGDFFQIIYDGAELYISSQFVEILQAEGSIYGVGVNIREYPTTESEIVGKVSQGDAIKVLGVTGEWFKVEAGGDVGYVKSDYVEGWAVTQVAQIDPPKMPVQENKLSAPQPVDDDVYAVVNASGGLRLREGASQEADIISVINTGAALQVLELQDEWIKVDYNGRIGHVSAEFITLRTGQIPEANGDKAQQILEYGKQFLGTPYQYAGNSLTGGVDCSGFVYNVFKDCGISLNRSSRDMVTNGVPISKGELQPGDLVFFDTTGVNDGNISHVGIYMGDGKFIHSSSSKRTWGVVISSMNEEYYIRTYVTSARVL